MKRITTYIYALECVLLLSGAYSCAEGTDAEQRSDGENRMVFAMTRSNQDIVNHTTVYQFDTSWQYMKKIQGVTYGTDDLSMRMDAGTWNLALVTGEDLNPTSVISPVNGEGRAGKMWQTQAVEGVLPSMPELRTAYIEDQVITPNITNYASTAMYRNVAMVRVYIEKTRGLDPTGTHTLYINGVPTTLNWAGELYPNKHTPDISTSPLKGTFSIHDKAGDAGFQESDVLEFIIPAHKGNDYLSPSPQDTTTHKLNLGVDLACAGGTRFTKNGVEISHAPRANSILEVRLSMVGELEVSAHILDWNEVEVNAALDYTELMVSKAKVELAYKDTIYVNTNAANFTVTPASGVLWMSAARIGTTNAVEITAEVSFYSSPRSSYFSVTANNLVKNIPVTQRPEKGTISALESFWVSPSSGNTTRTITVSSKGPWVLAAPNPATVTPNITSGGAGDTNIVFTRKAHTGMVADYSPYYGSSVFTVKNTQTLETITVTAENLFLEVPEQININGSGGTSYNDDIVVWGLSEEYVIVGVTYNATGNNWLTVSIENGRLKTTADREPNEQTRNCTLTIAHADDLSYTTQINIEQNPHYDIIDPFTYLTGRYLWESYKTDMDIAVFIYDDYKRSVFAEGYYMGYNGKFSVDANITYKNQLIAKYGGDPVAAATSMETGGEAFVIYMKSFDNLDIFPLGDGSDDKLSRYINIYMYAWWFNDAPTNGTAYLSLQYWLDGEIVKNEVGTSKKYVYTNPTGVDKNPDPGRKIISPIESRGSASANAVTIINHTNGMTKVARVRYDRLTHKATIVWYSSGDLPNWPTTNVALPQSMPLAGMMTTEEMQKDKESKNTEK